MDWLNKNSVIYQVMPDRFSTGNSAVDSNLSYETSKDWMGGNLKGMIKRITYLKKLGVSAVYLTPILKGKYYHGYHTIDYFEIDPHFGDKKDFEKLVKKLHKNEIKIIFDFVPNHCSDEHPFFKDAIKDPNSKYRDWFVFEEWPSKYLTFLSIKELSKWNTKNEEVKNYLISAASYWIKNFDLDGLRIDHAIGLSTEFLKDLRKELKEIKDDIVLIGEAGLARGLACGAPEVLREEDLKTLWCYESFNEKEKELIKSFSESFSSAAKSSNGIITPLGTYAEI